MILVDTSVWIDHFRSGEPVLEALLDRNQIMTHPFVLGELSLGNLRRRAEVLGALANLPAVAAANDPEVLSFVEAAGLYGLGVGYVDAHLLAAIRLTPGVELWTRDRRLRSAAETIGLASYHGH